MGNHHLTTKSGAENMYVWSAHAEMAFGFLGVSASVKDAGTAEQRLMGGYDGVHNFEAKQG